MPNFCSSSNPAKPILVRLSVIHSLKKHPHSYAKIDILLFPEGTSTNGERILPFQTVPFAAPLRNRSIILPVSIAYQSIDDEPVTVANRDLVYWYGDMEFSTHFWKLLSLRSIEVIVTIQPKIDCFRYKDNSAGRKKLAADCYNRVLGRLTEDDVTRDEAEETTRGDSTTSPLLVS